jgi:predicted metal-dependent TIM-barrel fold hydrolase
MRLHTSYDPETCPDVEEEEGLHGVHRRLRRNEHPKTKEALLEVQRTTGCHPQEAHSEKASVCETPDVVVPYLSGSHDPEGCTRQCRCPARDR